MIDSVGREFGRLDVLILNASGGLEKGKPAEYAMQLNLSAQVRLVDLSLTWMPRDARVVFVTSHMAHFYAERGMVGPYQPVAASKYAGEQALRGRRAELAKLGIHLAIVSGDMIEGTITPRLLERMDRGTTQARRDLHRAGEDDDLRIDLMLLQEAAEQVRIGSRDALAPQRLRALIRLLGRHRER